MKNKVNLIIILIICSVIICCKNNIYALGTPPIKVQNLIDEKIINIIESENLKIDERNINAIKSYRCYEYEDYVILVKDQTEVYKGKIHPRVGEKILIKSRKQNKEVGNLCEISYTHKYFKIEEWAGYFWGIHNNYLFIECGTGTMRSLAIYDLTKEEKIYSANYLSYNSQVKIEKNQNLIFYKRLGREIHSIEELNENKTICPDIKELEVWGRRGVRSFDLTNCACAVSENGGLSK